MPDTNTTPPAACPFCGVSRLDREEPEAFKCGSTKAARSSYCQTVGALQRITEMRVLGPQTAMEELLRLGYPVRPLPAAEPTGLGAATENPAGSPAEPPLEHHRV